MVEEAVVRKELNLEVKDAEGNPVLTFPSTEIYQTSLTNSNQGSEGESKFNMNN